MIGNIMEILLACINQYSSVRKRQGQEIAFLTILSSPSNADPPLPTGVGEGLYTPSPLLPFLPGPIKQQLTDKVGLPKSILRSTPFHSLNILETLFSTIGRKSPL